MREGAYLFLILIIVCVNIFVKTAKVSEYSDPDKVIGSFDVDLRKTIEALMMIDQNLAINFCIEIMPDIGRFCRDYLTVYFAVGSPAEDEGRNKKNSNKEEKVRKILKVYKKKKGLSNHQTERLIKKIMK